MCTRSTMRSRQMAAFGSSLVFTTSAVAQTLTVTFTSTAVDVPISPWATAALSALIAAIVFAPLRKACSRRFGPRRGWLLAAIGGTAVLIALPSESLLQMAHAAIDPTVFPLTTSPAQISINFIPGQFQAVNQTSAPLRITDMAVSGAACIGIVLPPTTCAIGATLGPAQSCIIGVQQEFEPCP